MKWLTLACGAVYLCAAHCGATACAGELSWEDIARGNTGITAVLVSEDDARQVYYANPSGVFKRHDDGLAWQRVFALPAGGNTVNSLVFGTDTTDTVYAACSNGLFRSTDAGASWQKTFDPPSGSVSGCTAAAESGNAVFAATGRGLYYSKEGAGRWIKARGRLGTSPVIALVRHPGKGHTLFCTSESGAWRTGDNGRAWEKIYSAGRADSASKEEFLEEAGEAEAAGLAFVRAIAVDPKAPYTVYLGTANGVVASSDNGDTWEHLPQQGLLDRDVRALFVSRDSRLYCLAGSRIYEYDQGRWQELSARLACGRVSGFTVDRSGVLYAACGQGLFMSIEGESEGPFPASRQTAYPEPTISQVQQAAIRYAEVDPKKISLWRAQAARKAWLPQLSLGFNNDVADFWHWEGGSTTREGDDFIRKGKQSLEWDVALKWDLAELIYNNDQTTIDVRSRLMVELRNDILDQVTKLYFERLKVLNELEGLTVEESKKREEKKLRLQELTACIDGLTGGCFSRAAGAAKNISARP